MLVSEVKQINNIEMFAQLYRSMQFTLGIDLIKQY